MRCTRLSWFNNRLQARESLSLREWWEAGPFTSSEEKNEQGLGSDWIATRTCQPQICFLGITDFKTCVEHISFLIFPSLVFFLLSHPREYWILDGNFGQPHSTDTWYPKEPRIEDRSDLEWSFSPSLSLGISTLWNRPLSIVNMAIGASQPIYSVVWSKNISTERHAVMS